MDLREWLRDRAAQLHRGNALSLLVLVALVAACGSAALPGGKGTDSLSASADGLTAQAVPGAAGAVPAAVPVKAPAPATSWRLAWRAETAFPGRTTVTTSCRFLAKLVASGSRIRAEFSGLANDSGYSVESASIAPATSLTSLEVQPGTSRPLTFDGAPGVTVGPGARLLTDPVTMPVRNGEAVLVTVTASAGDALVKGAKSEAGGCSGSALPSAATAPASAFPQMGNVHWLRSLLVDGPAQRIVAALGDSITEGPGPRYDGDYPRWTDVVARSGLSVVNAGVGGNAISRRGMFGTLAGVDRATPLLEEPGLTDLVLCLGTNDLALGQTDDEVLGALDTVIGAARAKGLRVWVCTISAREMPGWRTSQENRRETINAAVRGSWLRDRGAAPFDMDAALRDPAAPTYLRPAYDIGDHLHPNAAGAYAIGAAAAATFGLPVPPVTPESASSAPSAGV